MIASYGSSLKKFVKLGPLPPFGLDRRARIQFGRVDGGELRSPPELNNVVGEQHQLPLEGRGQGTFSSHERASKLQW